MLKSPPPLLVAGLAASFLVTSVVGPAYAQSVPTRLAQVGPAGAAPQPGGAQMDVQVFYDQLADYGTWVEHPDYQYVFIPSDVGPGWRPYQQGRWVWTDDYGWYWESDEPFGWATYHYGRWSYDPAYGWFWVPGDTWAPAWVKWRRGGGRTGWAPIGPDRPGFAVGQAQYYEPPIAESWVFVEDQYLGEPDMALYAAPIPETSVYLDAAPDEYDPAWQDGYYVNRGFAPTVYGNVVRNGIVTRQIVYVDASDELFYDDNRGWIGVYAPPIFFGDRYGPPPRLVRSIEPNRRVMVRQYVRNDARGAFAPSAALLSSLDENRRRELRQQRFADRDGYRRDVEGLQRQRSGQIQELRRASDLRGDTLERERRAAVEKRQQSLNQVRDQRRERASRVEARPGVAPGARPGVARPDGAGPGAPARRPDAPPGPRPDARPDVRPGVNPGDPAQGRVPRPEQMPQQGRQPRPDQPPQQGRPPRPEPEQQARPPRPAPEQQARPPRPGPEQQARPPRPAPEQQARPPRPAPEQQARPPRQQPPQQQPQQARPPRPAPEQQARPPRQQPPQQARPQGQQQPQQGRQPRPAPQDGQDPQDPRRRVPVPPQ